MATSKAKTLEAERRQDQLRQTAASKLCDWSWTDIDVITIADLIAELEDKLPKLKSGSAALIDLEGQRVAAKLAYTSLTTCQGELSGILRTGNDRLLSHRKMLQTARVEAGALEGKHRDALLTRLPSGWKPTLASLVSDVQRVKDKIQNEVMEIVIPDKRIPSGWMSTWKHNGDARVDEWETTFPQGVRRLGLLKLMTGGEKSAPCAKHVTKGTYVLMKAVYIGDFGQHQEGATIDPGTAYAALHLCIELVGALARELPDE